MAYPLGYGMGYPYGVGLAYRPVYVEPILVAPVVPVYMVGINPVLAPVLGWMDADIFRGWQEWQENIRGMNLSLEQRKNFLKRAMRRNVPFLPYEEKEEIVERILAMEPELGADQYGHVDTTQQNTIASTTHTTTTLTQQQRNQAGNLYLQNLNTSGSNMDPQEAQKPYNQIINGQLEQLAQHFLQTKPNKLGQQDVTQQVAPQQPALQQPVPQQPSLQQMMLQQMVPEQMAEQQTTQPNTQLRPQQALGHGQLDNVSQQMQSMTTTTTTTTTNSNNSNYYMQGDPVAQGYQQAMQNPQQQPNQQSPITLGSQGLGYQQQKMPQGWEQVPSPQVYQHTPPPPSQLTASQDYFRQNPQASTTRGQNLLQPATDRQRPSNQALSLKERREAGLSSRKSKGMK